MSLWILDTDHVSLALQEHPLVTARIKQRDSEVAITVITAQELLALLNEGMNHAGTGTSQNFR